MTVDRNLNLSLATIEIRILNDHRDRTINILTRRDNNIAVVINLNRNILAILIGGRDLRVLIRVVNDNASVLLLISRINRLHTRIINRRRLSNRQRNAVSYLVLFIVVVNQGVRHGDVWIVLVSLNFFSRSTGDLARLCIEGQTRRKISNRNRAFLHLELVRVALKAGRHNFLFVLDIDLRSL